MMATVRQRVDALSADHEGIHQRYGEIRDSGEPDPTDYENPPQVWLDWYEEFLPIKDRMYELAYELGIPFEMGGQASGAEYTRVWEAVQAVAAEDGNHRHGGKK